MVGTQESQEQLTIKSRKELHLTKTITIDKIMNDFKIEEIDILKMDIEGAEKEVFNNSRRWIQKVNAIVVELHERFKFGCNRAFYSTTNGFDNEWQSISDPYLFFLTKRNNIKK
jgi:hypothetical protein